MPAGHGTCGSSGLDLDMQGQVKKPSPHLDALLAEITRAGGEAVARAADAARRPEVEGDLPTVAGLGCPLRTNMVASSSRGYSAMAGQGGDGRDGARAFRRDSHA